MKDKITDTWTFKLNTVFQIGFSSLVEESFSSVGRNIPHPTGSALCVTLITNGIKLKRPQPTDFQQCKMGYKNHKIDQKKRLRPCLVVRQSVYSCFIII